MNRETKAAITVMEGVATRINARVESSKLTSIRVSFAVRSPAARKRPARKSWPVAGRGEGG
jgi:hypothetical protein